MADKLSAVNVNQPGIVVVDIAAEGDGIDKFGAQARTRKNLAAQCGGAVTDIRFEPEARRTFLWLVRIEKATAKCVLVAPQVVGVGGK